MVKSRLISSILFIIYSYIWLFKLLDERWNSLFFTKVMEPKKKTCNVYVRGPEWHAWSLLTCVFLFWRAWSLSTCVTLLARVLLIYHPWNVYAGGPYWKVLFDQARNRFLENWYMYWFQHKGKRMVPLTFCLWEVSFKTIKSVCQFNCTQALSMRLFQRADS